jgi:surface polysaccharide O-acyltransferase-like enzyme
MSLTSTLGTLSANTPASRNRVVDLLRGAAILVVVLGHWLMAAVYLDPDGEMHRGDLLAISAWTHPLTWMLQVMPVFFIVGGYANALSWRSAQAKGTPYGGWLRARLRRLTIPVLPLMLFWAVVAPVASALGVSGASLRIASMASLVPTWFLAAYVVIVALAPATLHLWERWGWWSVSVTIAAAALVDVVSIGGDLPWFGFLNYVLVWGAVHQLGYAWVDGALAGTRRRLTFAGFGFVALALLVTVGPYSISMVGVDGFGINNAYPTRVTLAFLGLFQGGVVLALEPVLRRLASKRGVWIATIFVNARIMTIYLWHLTALGLVVATSLAAGGLGLRIDPNTSQWWSTRPLWFLTLATVTAALVWLFGRFEQPGADPRPAPSGLRPVLAMVATCGGLGIMADLGIASLDGTVHWYLPLIPVIASFAFGISRLPWTRNPKGHADRSWPGSTSTRSSTRSERTRLA